MRELYQSPRRHAVLLRVSEAAYRKLQRTADTNEITVAELTRWALDEWFQAHGLPRKRKKRR